MRNNKKIICLLTIFIIFIYNSQARECFVAGTKILMADGSEKNIENIIAGEFVKSVDLPTFDIVSREVKEVVENYHTGIGDDYTVEIEFSEGTVNHNTNSHPYYVVDKGYASYLPARTKIDYGIDVEQLSQGDEVLKYINGSLEIIEITKIYENYTAAPHYNLSKVDQSSVQSEADMPEPDLTSKYDGRTLEAGTYTGTLLSNSYSYENPIQLVDNFLIHPDQFTTTQKITDRINEGKSIGPFSQPYSAGCQISSLNNFNAMTSTLEGVGFKYNGADQIDVTIKDDLKNK